MYCFVNWRKTSGYKELDLPDNCGYSVLAEPSDESDYVLAQVNHPLGCPPPVPPVSEELTELLNAAEQYAPALALTRADVRRREAAPQSEFEHHLSECLRHHLSEQRHQNHFLAAARVTQLDYKYAGMYYWIIGYQPNHVGHEVRWVSRDFYVYQDSVADFDVAAAYLEQRFG